MPVIKFTALGGLEPSIPPRALPDNGAQVANNINPGSPTFRALLGAGLLTSIDAAIDSLPSPQKEAARIEWEFSAEVQRSSGLVPMMGAALGLDDTALDALFIEAEGL